MTDTTALYRAGFDFRDGGNVKTQLIFPTKKYRAGFDFHDGGDMKAQLIFPTKKTVPDLIFLTEGI